MDAPVDTGVRSVAGEASATRCDPVVILVVGLLMTLGAAMAYSASVRVDDPPFDLRGSWSGPLRQSVYAAVGFAAMLIAASVNQRIVAWREPGQAWRPWSVYVLTVALLAAVFVPGVGVSGGGALRSIALIPGRLTFQPSEVAKIALVAWLAAILAAPTVDIRRFATFVAVASGGGGLVLLVAFEDYGTGALLGIVTILLLYAGGARWSHLALLGGAALAAGAVLLFAKWYRVMRILNWWSGDADPLDGGYQSRQALLGIGAGGWWGRGLGGGVQKYGYLPQAHNDFVLATLCEELGVIGGLGVVALFLVLLGRGWWIAAHAPERFDRLLAMGLTLIITLQAAFNIGVATAALPPKGISLPFVSAGGSGVVFMGCAAGLLAAVGGHAVSKPTARARRARRQTLAARGVSGSRRALRGSCEGPA